MEVYEAEFIISQPKESMCPKDGVPEFAFIGRSNVGKSSLINMLTGRKGLAKVSGTPGKTRLLNYFLINKKWYLVDLPGYGYARLSKSAQQALATMIRDYFEHRPSLALAFVLIDSNIEPSKTDLAFVDQLGELGVPFVLAFTKTDRMKPGALQRNVDLFLKAMSETWETLPPYVLTSSEYRTGRAELLGHISETLKAVKKQ
jgi:GTP-binding protein